MRESESLRHVDQVESIDRAVRCCNCNALLTRITLHIPDNMEMGGLKVVSETKCKRCKELNTKIFVAE